MIKLDAKAFLTALRKAPILTKKVLSLGLRKVAMHGYKRLKMETPKGFTGQTRRSWYVKNNSSRNISMFVLGNPSKIMKYLEFGTSSHGPRKAKLLYIPLTRKASIGGWNKELKFGKHYVFAKKVSGIKPLRIVSRQGRMMQRKMQMVVSHIELNLLTLFR